MGNVLGRAALLLALAAGTVCAPAESAFAQADSGAAPADTAAAVAAVAPPPLPADVRVIDLPNDNGTGLVVIWADDPSVPDSVMYHVDIATAPTGPFYPVGMVPASGPLASEDPGTFGLVQDYGDRQYITVTTYSAPQDTGEAKTESLVAGETYYIRFSATLGPAVATLPTILSGSPEQDYFKWNKLNTLIFILFFGTVILLFIEMARRNPNMYIRKIAGLDAVEESLGRATEMGKPVYFVHGLHAMGDISTIAAVNILRPIARRTAQYDTLLKVMNMDPIVQAVSQEVVREGCIDVGRPDAYNEENVMFVADRQFSYAAAVDGLMVRERPATVILMGYFYAEALLFTETGNQIGAIQIAGTDAYTQLPFFITTCDYTLMGEELYAASAYLSREPKLLGSLRGQDVGKALILAVLTIGTLLELFGVHWLSRLVQPL